MCKCLLELYRLVCSLYHYVVSFFVSHYSLGFKVYFLGHKYCYPSLFSLSICMKYLFPIPLLLVCVYLLIWDGSLGDSMYLGLVCLSIQLPYVFWLEHLSYLHVKWLLICISLMASDAEHLFIGLWALCMSINVVLKILTIKRKTLKCIDITILAFGIVFVVIFFFCSEYMLFK